MTKLFYRSVKPEEAKLNEKERTAEISFSSEYPVTRYFGSEILLHGEKNVDLTYLNDVGSVLARHGGGLRDIVGPIHKAWLDDRNGAAIIGFDDDENGNLAISKMRSKSLRGISFGYQIERGRRLEDENDVWEDPDTRIEYRGPAVIGTFWRANEITLTPIPADPTVGFNRSMLDNIYFEELTRNITEDSRMDEKDRKEIGEMIRSALKDHSGLTKDDVRSIISELKTEDLIPKIKVTKQALNDLMSRAGAVSDACKADLFDAAVAGKSEVEMLTLINDRALENNQTDAKHNDSAGNDPKGDTGDDGKGGIRTMEDLTDDMFLNCF